jgi:gas vesicle protein GvpL/GvpF
MAAQAGPEGARDRAPSGCYLYGIVPADVVLASDVRGVGNPPTRVQLVRQADLGALVSVVDLTRGLGTPEDLQAHAQVLDATAVEVPVLPGRRGSGWARSSTRRSSPSGRLTPGL